MPLEEAVLQFQSDAKEFEEWESEWERVVYSSGGFESASLEAHRMSHNTRMADFETHLLDLESGGGVSLVLFSSFPFLFLLGTNWNKLLKYIKVAWKGTIQAYPFRAASLVRL
jgi:Transferrin receptor-like dimerisation domain